MSTAGYTELYGVLRSRILTFVDPAGRTWASISGAAAGVGNDARLWQDGAPVGFSSWPYGVMRIVDDVNDGPYQQRTVFSLEIMVYGRPRTQLDKVRDLADLIDGALLQYRYSAPTEGFVKVTGRRRNMLPMGTGDVDAEVVTSRQLFSGFAWPKFLTSIPT